VKDEEIKHRWREYFDKLFNGETERSTIELDDSFDDTSRINISESLLFIMDIAFYYEMLHRMLNMECCKFPP
jgi:hypothetical protein